LTKKLQKQRGAATSNAQVGQKLNNGSPEDYIKEAIDAKAERDAEIVKIEKEVQEGTEKRPKVFVDERAVDHTKMPVDYIKEAVDAKAQRDADDSKVEKPLADQMVRQGYLREKGAAARMAERAVDHTKITASMKEASEITGVEVQVLFGAVAFSHNILFCVSRK
jgi:predicted RND superfamily exporter protein